MKTEITAKKLLSLGYKSGPWIPLVLEAIQKGDLKHATDEQRLEVAEDVLVNPDKYYGTDYWDKVVVKLYPPKSPQTLRETPVPVTVYGNSIIETGAFTQIYQAAKLPVSVKASLMPDAHQGYGLPIGGVLATKDAVIPYGVGVDIGCRMALTVYPMRDFEDAKIHSDLCAAISKNTFFGTGAERNRIAEHEVLDNNVFNSTHLLRSLKDRAAKQLGTSGSGNHFVEFGEIDLAENSLGLEPGKYLGLLTHSGSRGLGANIARHYTNAAKRLRYGLDSSVSNLAWLMMSEQEGVEYWEAMNLAGDYAKACHDVIHNTIAKYINEVPLLKIENHHNFAWKEIHDGEELIVHRKGATPAGKGVLGIIPGSMSTPGFVVSGLGKDDSLHSASHGAGRAMSRTAAIQTFNWDTVKEDLKNKKVHLLGGGLDESSGSYKDVNAVMQYQTDLVEIIAKFMPRIVKMAGSNEPAED